jgi:hypothetical protein
MTEINSLLATFVCGDYVGSAAVQQTNASQIAVGHPCKNSSPSTDQI